jgi:alkylhydroperoxidase family enzyme
VKQLDIPGGSALSAQQLLAIRMTDAMTVNLDVSDQLYEEVRRHFDAQGQIDLVATIAAYNMVSRFLIALKIGH